MEVFLSILGALGGVAGIISIIEVVLNTRNNHYLAVHEFLSGLDDAEFISARAAVYNHTGVQRLDDKDIAIVVNYFHHWGLLAKKKYLPLWVFDYGSGAGVIRLYEITKEYIAQRRKVHEDSTYALGFEWLYYILKSRNINKI